MSFSPQSAAVRRLKYPFAGLGPCPCPIEVEHIHQAKHHACCIEEMICSTTSPKIIVGTNTFLKENGISVASCAISQEARICTFHPRDKALMHFQYVFQFLGRGAGINQVTICVEQICIGGQYADVFRGSGCHDAFLVGAQLAMGSSEFPWCFVFPFLCPTCWELEPSPETI